MFNIKFPEVSMYCRPHILSRILCFEKGSSYSSLVMETEK